MAIKIMVFEEDTLETVKNKLVSILNSNLEDGNVISAKCVKSRQLKIYGDNEKEILQNRMSFKILDNFEDTDPNSNNQKIIYNKFKHDDKNLYKNVMYCNDLLFPEHIKHDRVLEEIFISTNTCLDYVNENKPEELSLYLSFTNVEDADLIWLNREQIKKEFELVIECFSDVEIFVNKVKNNLFPFDNSKTDVFEKIKIGTLLDMDLHEILNAVWKFAQRSCYKTEIIKRLKEELNDSSGICCSGLAARLINSIQGFFDENKYPSLKIKISIDDEMKCKINQLISNSAIKRDIDPLYDADKFKLMVDEIIKLHSQNIMDEFTPEDILRNGINEENILRVAYELYEIK